MGALFIIRALFSHSCPYPRLGTSEGTRARMDKFPVATGSFHGYRSPVAAKSATDLGGSTSRRRDSAPITIAGAFFVPASLRYGGLRRSTLGCAGLRLPRSANPMQLATLICLAAERGGSSEVNGATPMKQALIPSAIRALAHRRMALSALRANSSLSVRLKRYNHHMDQARALEAQGGVQ